MRNGTQQQEVSLSVSIHLPGRRVVFCTAGVAVVLFFAKKEPETID